MKFLVKNIREIFASPLLRVVFLAALFARVAFAFLIWTPGFQSPYTSMSNMYVRSAYGILSGHGYAQYLPGSDAYNDIREKVINPARKKWVYPRVRPGELSMEGIYAETLHPPGWSLVGAAATFLTHIPVWYIMQVLTIIADLIALILLFGLLKKLKVSSTAIIISLIFYAVFPPIIFQTVNVRPEGFMSFFILLITTFFVEYYQSGKTKHLLFAAIASGLMSYFRPDFILYLPFLCLIFTYDLFKKFSFKSLLKYIARPVFALTVSIIILLPWGLRNYDHYGKLILTSSGAGCTLVTGLGTYPNPWGFGPSDDDRQQEAVEAGFAHAFNVEADDFFKNKFYEAVKENPKAYLKIIAKRFIQPIAPPYSWGIKRSEGVSYTKFRSNGNNILSEPFILVKNYWSDLISMILMFFGNLGIIWIFIKEKKNVVLKLVPVLAYTYAVISHVFTHMAPYYLQPVIFAEIIGLAYLITYFINELVKIFNHTLSKYLITGLATALLELGLYKVLTLITDNYSFAHVSSYILSASINFLISKYYVFKDATNTFWVQATTFIIVVILSGLINTSLFVLLVRNDANDLFAKIIAIIISVVFNFATKRLIVFARR